MSLGSVGNQAGAVVGEAGWGQDTKALLPAPQEVLNLIKEVQGLHTDE